MPDLAGKTVGVECRVVSAANVMVVVLFSLVGLAAFRYGKKAGEARPMFLGAALMVYGYFFSNAWVSLLVGATLTALLFDPQ